MRAVRWFTVFPWCDGLTAGLHHLGNEAGIAGLVPSKGLCLVLRLQLYQSFPRISPRDMLPKSLAGSLLLRWALGIVYTNRGSPTHRHGLYGRIMFCRGRLGPKCYNTL